MDTDTEKALRFAPAHHRQLANGLPLRREELAVEEEKLRVIDEKLAKVQAQRDKAHDRVVEKENEIEIIEITIENLDDLVYNLERPRESFAVDDDEYAVLRRGWLEELTRITRPAAFSLMGGF